MATRTDLLSRLPAELVEQIAQRLETNDICNLRLANTVLANKSQDIFKTCMTNKRIKLEPKPVETFCAMMRPGYPGLLLQNLTIVGVAGVRFDQDSGVPETLARGLQEWQSHSGNSILSSLTLDMVYRKTDGDTPIERELRPDDMAWAAIGRTFNTTASALATSRLPIRKLDLFSNLKTNALGLNYVAAATAAYDLSPSLRHVERLALRVSIRYNARQGEQRYLLMRFKYSDWDPSLAPQLQADRDGLKTLVGLCPSVQDLELQVSQTCFQDDGCDYARDERPFSNVVAALRPGQLRRLVLGGLRVTETELLGFVASHPLEYVVFDCVFLHQYLRRPMGRGDAVHPPGQFRRIFDCLTRDESPLKRIDMHNLWERYKLVHPPSSSGRQRIEYGLDETQEMSEDIMARPYRTGREPGRDYDPGHLRKK
ncbi:Uu.00g029040.m01.CDS01 [Anthostomella pinea]|uniref:Uu.00g029040.m01.CDS01 n=1 Tax=Anthostomella pinea TaxID=933095 RepID=A0AAI8V917_9PEZI|nr:Uu.00g029040.m01.CDS01 [Anthostomella pinea]